MPRWRIGELDQRVEFLSQSLVDDGAGGVDVAWVSIADLVPALIRAQRGRETESGERVEATGAYLVVVRNREDLSEGDICRWEGRDLNIRFIRSAGAREMFLEIDAEIGAAI